MFNSCKCSVITYMYNAYGFIYQATNTYLRWWWSAPVMPTWNLVPQLVHDTPKQKSWKIYWTPAHPKFVRLHGPQHKQTNCLNGNFRIPRSLQTRIPFHLQRRIRHGNPCGGRRAIFSGTPSHAPFAESQLIRYVGGGDSIIRRITIRL